jgi:hypothetical protein
LWESEDLSLKKLLSQNFQHCEDWAQLWRLPLETITQQIQVNAAIALSKLKFHFDSLFYCYIPTSDQLDGFHDFCMFFFRRPSHNEFSLESKQEYLDRMLRLWSAIYSSLEIHRGNIPSIRAAHAALLHCIDPGLRAKLISRDAHGDSWIVFGISHETWLSIQRQLNDKLGFIVHLKLVQWRQQYKTETRWHESTSLSDPKLSNMLHKRPGNIDVRVKLQPFLYQVLLLDRGADPPSVLYQLVHAYNPTLKINEVIEMLKDGLSESQQHIMIPKYLGGVLIDGSQSRITIV